jgi:hypothetical protein
MIELKNLEVRIHKKNQANLNRFLIMNLYAKK